MPGVLFSFGFLVSFLRTGINARSIALLVVTNLNNLNLCKFFFQNSFLRLKKLFFRNRLNDPFLGNVGIFLDSI